VIHGQYESWDALSSHQNVEILVNSNIFDQKNKFLTGCGNAL